MTPKPEPAPTPTPPKPPADAWIKSEAQWARDFYTGVFKYGR